MIVYKQKKRIMEVLKTFDLEEIPNPHKISVRALHISDQAQFEHLLLQAGEELKLHITYSTVYLYVLEGKGIVEAGDEQVVLEANMFVVIHPEVPHRLINDSESVFRVLNAKAPRPKKPTHLVS